MASLTLKDGRTISFPDGLKPDQVKKIVTAASQSGSMPTEDSGPAKPDIGTINPDGSLSFSPEVRQKAAQSEFNDLPAWAKPIVAADDIATLGASGALFGYGEKLGAGIDTLLGRGSYEDRLAYHRDKVQEARDRAGGAGLVAEAAGAIATPMKLAKAGATFTRLPGLLGRAGGLAADGAVIGAVDAAGHDRDVKEGAILGAGAGLVGQALVSGGSRLASPFLASPERLAAARALEGEGVTLTAGQRTGNNALRYAESELGGARTQAIAERQREQFTRAVLRRVGEDADRATPEVMDRAFTRIGNEFDRLSRNALIPDTQMATDLTRIGIDYGGRLPPSMRVPLIERTLTDTLGLLQSGHMDGSVYKSLRSGLDRFARETSQPEAKEAARLIISVLDDGMERSIQQLNPRDIGAWRNARSQYRNMLVVEQAATGAGEATADGLITASRLRQATVSKHGRRNYARGQGPYAELARAGEATMREMPNSGTASRVAARFVPNAVGALLGGGYQSWNGGDAIQGAVAGAAAPWLLGRVLMSPVAQRYLGNQLAAGIAPGSRAVTSRALTATGATSLLGRER